MASSFAVENAFVDISARVGHVAVICNNLMLVWGGYKTADEYGDIYLPPTEINIYHTDFQYWTRHETSGQNPPGTSGGAAVLVNENLYLLGGHILGGNTNSLYCLNLKNLEWTDLTSLEKDSWPSSRDKFTAWTYQNKIYCFGGFGVNFKKSLHDVGTFVLDDSSDLSRSVGWNNQLLEYDINTETWCNPPCKGMPPLPRAAHAAVRIKKNVYIFGGRFTKYRMNDLHILDLDTYTWSGEVHVDGAVPCGRSWHTFTAVSDDVAFLYGGYSTDRIPLSDAWQLNIDARQWSQVTVELYQPRLWHTCCCTDDGELLVFGGCKNDILNYTEPCLPANDILSFCLKPLKLQRLCLEASYKYKQYTFKDWPSLPKLLHEWLLKKAYAETVRKHDKQTHEVELKPLQGSTCSVS